MKVLKLLKSVARSFYLTIWWLPPTLREPVALAYLLARASDTIIDEEKHLMSKSEQELIHALPVLIESLNDPRRNHFDADAIKSVWKTILEGQQWDLEKFSQHQTALTPEKLECYLYLVAGCVGEFWTTIAAYHLPNFSREPLGKMIAWGIDYGKGLQLINILRDRHRDQRVGRYYCTDDQVSQLYAQALIYLQQGEIYVNVLRPGRFKVATALPLLLGKQTLSLLKKHPNSDGLKIKRWRVYITLIGALRFLFWY